MWRWSARCRLRLRAGQVHQREVRQACPAYERTTGIVAVMRASDGARARPLRRRGSGLIALTLLSAMVLVDGAQATSAKPVMVKRCGYTNATSGRSALYPWHMSCVAARKVVTGSGNHHAQVIDFGPGWDGGAVRINGRYWVCTGQMGYYNCGYPYRPQKVKGEQGYKGPFTEDVEYQTCSVLPKGSGCATTAEFTQPRS